MPRHPLAALAVLALLTACAPRSAEQPPPESAAAGERAPAPVTPAPVTPAPGTVVPAPAEGGVVPAPGAESAAGDPDLAALRRLEREAVALARTDGCAGPEQCAMAPVGSRPCGGPRHYIPYCRTSTDSAALFRKLDELARAERAYNTKRQIGSTCEFREPPTRTLSGGRCGPAPGQ